MSDRKKSTLVKIHEERLSDSRKRNQGHRKTGRKTQPRRVYRVIGVNASPKRAKIAFGNVVAGGKIRKKGVNSKNKHEVNDKIELILPCDRR